MKSKMESRFFFFFFFFFFFCAASSKNSLKRIFPSCQSNLNSTIKHAPNKIILQFQLVSQVSVEHLKKSKKEIKSWSWHNNNNMPTWWKGKSVGGSPPTAAMCYTDLIIPTPALLPTYPPQNKPETRLIANVLIKTRSKHTDVCKER